MVEPRTYVRALHELIAKREQTMRATTNPCTRALISLQINQLQNLLNEEQAHAHPTDD